MEYQVSAIKKRNTQLCSVLTVFVAATLQPEVVYAGPFDSIKKARNSAKTKNQDAERAKSDAVGTKSKATELELSNNSGSGKSASRTKPSGPKASSSDGSARYDYSSYLREKDTLCPTLKKAPRNLKNVQQSLKNQAIINVASCNDTKDDHKMADVLAAQSLKMRKIASPLARLNNFIECSGGWDYFPKLTIDAEETDGKKLFETEFGKLTPMMAFAVCHSAVPHPIDSDAIKKEIREYKLSDVARHYITQNALHAATVFNQMKTAYTWVSKMDKDLGYALWKAPRKAIIEWNAKRKSYPSMSTYLELSDRYVKHAASRKGLAQAFAGCKEDVLTKWQKRVSGINPKGYEGFYDEMKKADMRYLTSSVFLCLFALQDYTDAMLIHRTANPRPDVAVERFPVSPRFAAVDAVESSLGEIRKDRAQVPWKGDGSVSLSRMEALSARGINKDAVIAIAEKQWKHKFGYVEDVSGQVKSVKKDKDGKVIVVFRPEKYTTDKLKCRQSKEVQKIDSEGRLVYYNDCKVIGKNQHTYQAKSLRISPEFATGVKPGARITGGCLKDEGSAPSYTCYADVLQPGKKKSSPKLTHVYGSKL